MRLTPRSIDVDLERLQTDRSYRDVVQRNSIEVTPQFMLGFVEFDDQGWFWDRNQLRSFEAAVRDDDQAAKNGAIIVVFVHGWKHSADCCDHNVTCFRDVLKVLQQDEQKFAAAISKHGGPRKARRIVGLYVGWRGLSVKPKVLRELSFFNRKAVAHRIGDAGDSIRLLTRLNRLTKGLGSSRLVVVGHSFGGTLVFSALAGKLKDVAEGNLPDTFPDGDQCPERLKRLFLDEAMYILVNPAFEASRYAGLHELAVDSRCADDRQSPFLIIVGSKNDQATRGWFQLGRRTSTLFEKTRDAGQRTAMIKAIGHHDAFVTHRLERRTRDAVPEQTGYAKDKKAEKSCACEYRIDVLSPAEFPDPPVPNPNWRQVLPANANWILRDPHNGIGDNTPFMVVNATEDVIPGHNEIYSSVFIEFLRDIIIAVNRTTPQDPELGGNEVATVD
ncbi:hypothetical protein EHM82_01270 [bacterium]|nr:MAG: hypothetical protein EHM82_01270 [bacterium]